MSLWSSTRAAFARRFQLTPENKHHGVQLAVAVLLAWFIPAAFGMREHFWALMSTLIVMRPDTGGTLDAGWDRMRGTLIGAASGLLGSAIQHAGSNALMTTLAIVAVLAFVGALNPAWRSAPIAALIVLSAGALPGHTSLQAAELRVLQIGMGVGIAATLSLLTSRYHAAARVEFGCAEMLKNMAEQIRQPYHIAATEQAELQAVATRRALGKLAILAASADLEAHLLRRRKAQQQRRHHKTMVGLVTRVVQDTTMLKRTLLIAIKHGDKELARAARESASAAIASVAASIAGTGQPALAALRQLDQQPLWRDEAASASTRTSAATLAAPIRLLYEDLEKLCTRA